MILNINGNIKEISHDKIKYKKTIRTSIVFDSDFDEYRVNLLVDNVVQEKLTYFTDDRKDAIETGKAMIKYYNNKTTKIDRTAKGYNLKGQECFIKVGDKVRAWDFEPMPNREEAYVEGEFTGWSDDNRLIISIEKDTLFPEGHRTEILTPAEVIFGEWAGRLTKLN